MMAYCGHYRHLLKIKVLITYELAKFMKYTELSYDIVTESNIPPCIN